MRRRARIHPLIIASILTALSLGCDSSDGDAIAPAVDSNAECADIAATCLARNQGCTVTDGQPACAACEKGQYATGELAACTVLPGTSMSHDFGIQQLEAAQEIGSLCQTWVLDNDEPLYVNAVELENDGYYHHSNWFFVPEDYEGWTTEPWVNCYDEGFSEIGAALAGGVIYAQSTQVQFELQKFQDGAVIKIPARSRIIGATHLLNYTPEGVSTGLRMTLHALDTEEIKTPLTPAQLIYTALAIPPVSRSTAGATCDLEAAHQSMFKTPLDMKIHYILPHYHALGESFEVTVVGGPNDGMKLVDHGGYAAEPLGYVFDPPIDLKGATGLSFNCGFNNPRDEVIVWGIGDQEMCEALLFVESTMAFSAGVSETSSIETVNSIESHSGSCDVQAFAFDADKDY